MAKFRIRKLNEFLVWLAKRRNDRSILFGLDFLNESKSSSRESSRPIILDKLVLDIPTLTHVGGLNLVEKLLKSISSSRINSSETLVNVDNIRVQ